MSVKRELVTPGSNDPAKLHNLRQWIRQRSPRGTKAHLPLHITMLLVGVVGTYLLLLSSADNNNLQYSSDPNNVVVQYSLPRVHRAVSNTNLAAPDTDSPFTLYGNGLLVCQNGSKVPVLHSRVAPPPITTNTSALPTATTLQPQEISDLLKQIEGTGFFTLNKEYYNQPLSEAQDILRVSLVSGDHYTLYYNDVTPPAAYTQTLAILEFYCKRADTPYQPTNLTLRVLKNPTTPSQPAVSAESLPPAVNRAIQSGLAGADKKQASANTSLVNTQARTINSSEADKVLSGGDAQALVEQFFSQNRQYIQQNGSTYEVEVEPQLPAIKNPLNVNYAAIRSHASGLGARLKQWITPHAYATGSIPIRVVVLLGSDGGSTQNQAAAQARGQAVHDWYCGQVKACYNYSGTYVMTGSQTTSYYMTCHSNESSCLQTVNCNGVTYSNVSDPLVSTLYNVKDSDYGTIFRNDVDTVLVTGWSTNEINTPTTNCGGCGNAFIGLNLAALDYYEPTAASGVNWYCQPGHDMAHEQGHNFGLNHTDDNTLMDGNIYNPSTGTTTLVPAEHCDIGSTLEGPCTLDSGQATTLYNNASFFMPTSTSMPAPAPTWQAGWTTGYSSMPDLNTNGTSCLDVPYASTSNGVKLQQWHCWSTLGQQWQLQASSTTGYYIVVNRASNKCIDVPYGSTSNGVRLQQWSCWSSDQQLWKVVPSSTAGYYSLQNKKSNLCMDVAYSSTNNGTFVQQWNCWNTPGQKWGGAALSSAAAY